MKEEITLTIDIFICLWKWSTVILKWYAKRISFEGIQGHLRTVRSNTVNGSEAKLLLSRAMGIRGDFNKKFSLVFADKV